MAEPLASLGIDLLATGIATGTGIAAATVREELRQRRGFYSIKNVAAEFNEALK